MVNRAIPSCPALVFPVFGVLALLFVDWCAAAEAEQQAAGDAETAELRINGALIEKLVLVGNANRVFELEHPPSSVSLPPT